MFEEILPNIYLITNLKDEFHFSTKVTLVGGGASYEEKEERGLSHLIEHTLVARTKKLTQEELQDYLFENEVYLNASTSPEELEIIGSGHKELSKAILDMILEMTFNPTITQETFEKERSIILKEIKERNGDPEYIFYRDLNKEIFKKGSESRRSISGFSKTVKNCKLNQIIDLFYKINERSHIIIKAVGGCEFRTHLELKSYIIKYLDENWTVKNTKVNSKIFEHKLKNSFKNYSTKAFVHKYAHRHLNLTIKIPNLIKSYENRVPALILSELLFWNPGGYIYNRLRNELGIVYNVSAGFVRDLESFVIDLYTDLSGVMKVFDEIDLVLRNPPKYISKKKFEIFKNTIKRRAEINTDKSNFIPNYMFELLTTYGKEKVDDYMNNYIKDIQNADFNKLLEFAELMSSKYKEGKKILVVSQNQNISKLKFIN